MLCLSMGEVGRVFTILWHFTAEWLPSHTGHGVTWGGGATVLLVSPGFVTDEKKAWPVRVSLHRFGLVTWTGCSFVSVTLLLSLLRASGDNKGSLATSVSCVTNWMKFLNRTEFWHLACSSLTNLHQLMPQWEGRFADRVASIWLESSSTINFKVFITSWKHTKKSENSWSPLESPSFKFGQFSKFDL